MWNIPNTLTTFRLFLIPVFLVIFYLPYSWAFFAAAFIFWLASITDALIIISREIIISALREWMAEQGKRGNVAVSNMGKIKTAAQMLAIIGLIWQYDTWMNYLSFGLLYIATFLTLSSMMQYLRAAWGELTKN